MKNKKTMFEKTIEELGIEYNNFPMRPLGWLSPREFIEKYKSQEESLFTI